MRRLDGESWSRRGFTSEDLVNRPIGILRDADRTLGREHRPERIKAWYALLRESASHRPGGAGCWSASVSIGLREH